MMTNGGKRDVMMRERLMAGSWSALFPAGYGERRLKQTG